MKLGILLVAFQFSIGVLYAYITGSGKAAYIKAAHGIDLPWYQAAALNVTVNDNRVKADVKNQ